MMRSSRLLDVAHDVEMHLIGRGCLLGGVEHLDPQADETSGGLAAGFAEDAGLDGEVGQGEPLFVEVAPLEVDRGLADHVVGQQRVVVQQLDLQVAAPRQRVHEPGHPRLLVHRVELRRLRVLHVRLRRLVILVYVHRLAAQR